MNTKRNIAIAVATALGIGLVLNAGVLAHGPGYGYGGGHMMGGHGYGGHRTTTYGEQAPAVGHHHGLGPVWMLDLTEEQRAEIGKVHDNLRKQHWELRGKLQEQYGRLAELNDAPTVEKAAIDEVHDKIFELRRQLVQTSTDARAETEKLLTDEQRKNFTGWHRGGPGPCMEYGRDS